MTTELTKAAQQALEALEEIHNGRRHPRLALAVAHNLRRALTQRPAAQTEREDFEAWHRQAFGYTPTLIPEMGGNYRAHTSRVGWSAWQARASLPAPQQATPEPVGEVVAWLYAEDGETKFGHPQGHHPKDARPLVFGDTHHAPGVPEGFALVPMTEDELNEMALQLGREMKGLRCWGWMDLVRAVERHHSKKLAAAQAKGGV